MVRRRAAVLLMSSSSSRVRSVDSALEPETDALVMLEKLFKVEVKVVENAPLRTLEDLFRWFQWRVLALTHNAAVDPVFSVSPVS